MTKCLIVINDYAPRFTRQVTRLSDELKNRGVSVTISKAAAVPLYIGGDYKPDFDFCIYLDKNKYIARLLENKGVRLFNRASAIEICDDKMLTHIALDGVVPMPKTVAAPLCYYADATPDKDFLDYVENVLGLPTVVKQSYGSQGNGVFLAKNRKELNALAEKLKLSPHLYQQFISSSYGKDMRVIVVGDGVVGSIIRTSTVDFRSNIGLGGKAEKCDAPSEIKKIALDAAKALNLDYCGIDVLLGDKPLLCEVNSNAFFDAFEAATSINVAKRYVDYILSKID